MGKRVPNNMIKKPAPVIDTKQKIACVTGSSGFLGVNLCKVLIEKGYKVAPFPRELFLDAVAMTKWLKEANPSLIVHLASYGNHSTQKDYNQTMLANVVNLYTLLEASKDIPYDAFINVSSSSVYGRKVTPMRENMLPEPENMYGCTKAAGEFIARAYALDLKKPIVTLRPFSVYGPGEADHRLIPTLIRSFLLNEHVELSDSPVHDWVYIEDFIDGLLLTADKAKNLRGNIVNIGTGRQVDNRYIYEVLRGLTGKEGRVKHNMDSGRDYDLKLWRSDGSVLRAFGWTPQIAVEQGLWHTFMYYKDLYAPSPLAQYIKETTEAI